MMLSILLDEFHVKLADLKDLVPRDAEFPEAPGKIKVAIGSRRAGKTYFMYQKILELLAARVDRKTILYINFEDDRLLPLNAKKFAALVDGFYTLFPENHDKKCYFFFDEVQNIADWPMVVRRLHDSKKAEIFLTGSSAKLLSKEIATNLRGRSLSVEIWPYDFDEFQVAKKKSVDRTIFGARAQDQLRALFETYLSEGGFPEIIPYEADVKRKTLQEYLDVATYRDLIERHEIKHPTLIKYMILTMMHNVGRPFTINKFYNDVKTQGYQVGKDVLYDYADYIEDAYLAFSLPIYSKSIRKVQTNPKKIYAIDPGMVRALTLDYNDDLGRLFENIVFLDLKRFEGVISYYVTNEGYEVDFLVKLPNGKKKLFQVVWDMHDPKTLEREERALHSAMKELKIEGEIVTLQSYLEQGIDFREEGKKSV